MRFVNKPIKSALLMICVFLIVLSMACTGGTQENAESQSTALESTVEALPTESPEPVSSAAPTRPDPAQLLDEQPYNSQTGAYSLFFPRNWKCSEIGPYRTDCQSPDDTSTITVRATHTGYELVQADFERLAIADLTYLYGIKRAYSETETESGEGEYVSRATWQEAGIPWQSIDHFYRRDYTVYQISFAAVQERWTDYEPLFEVVGERAAFSPAGMASAPLYALRREYTDPGVFYTLEMPTSWTKYYEEGSITRTKMDLFESPDEHARIDAALYQQDSRLSAEDKALWTRTIIKNTYAKNDNLEYISDKSLPDGRELLIWKVESKSLSGWSYFDSYSGSLFILTFLWDDSTAYVYETFLIEDIGGTFQLK